jgi:hypothetical protein
MPIKGWYSGNRENLTADTGLGDPNTGNALQQLASLIQAERTAGYGRQAEPTFSPRPPKKDYHQRRMEDLEHRKAEQELYQDKAASKEALAKAGMDRLYQMQLQRADIRGPRTEYLPTGGYGFRPVEVEGSLPWSMRPKTSQMVQEGSTPEERMREQRMGLETAADLEGSAREQAARLNPQRAGKGALWSWLMQGAGRGEGGRS